MSPSSRGRGFERDARDISALSSDEFRVMGEDAFRDLFFQTAKSSSPPTTALVGEINARVAAGRMQPADLAHLISFVYSARHLRTSLAPPLLAWLEANPGEATAVAGIVVARFKWTVATSANAFGPDEYQAKTRLRIGDTTYLSEWVSASTKRLAERKSVTAAFRAALGMRLEVAPLDPPPPNDLGPIFARPLDPITEDVPSKAFALLPALDSAPIAPREVKAQASAAMSDLLTKRRQLSSNGPKYELNERAKQRGEPAPVYRVTSSGPDHSPKFSCEVLSGPNGELSVMASGLTRKEAENAAAALLLARLADSTAVVSPQPAPAFQASQNQLLPAAVVVLAANNPKGAIVKISHDSGWLVPVYDTVRVGPEHQPHFIATLTLGTPDLEACSAIGTTRKEAEANAAIQALRNLGIETSAETGLPSVSID